MKINICKLFKYIAFGSISVLCIQIWWIYNGRNGNVERNNGVGLEHYRPTTSPQLIFYNKVSKCGSSSLLSAASAMTWKNNFKVHQHKVEPNLTKRPKREDLLSEIRIVSNLTRPGLYARHVYYIDFRKYGYEQPIYINMIRDPVERFVSNFYFDQVGSYGENKTAKVKYNINDCILHGHSRCESDFHTFFMIYFFCGQDNICVYNKTKALQLAKKHITEEYLFVGITEEFDDTLKILERLLPSFFEGLYKGWKRLESAKLHKFSTKFKHELTDKAKNILKKRLTSEYELYDFVKRLFQERKQSLNL